MGRKGYGLVLTADLHDLDSVNAINSSLFETYSLISEENHLRFFGVSDLSRRFPLSVNYGPFLSELHSDPPEFVIVTHGAIYRSYFFRLLLMVLHKKPTRFYFHIYGDYLRQVDLWLSLEGVLLGRRVAFILPSRAYLSVVQKTLSSSSNASMVPYALTSPHSTCSKQHPTTDRIIFIYSGRISKQKKLSEAIHTLEHLQQKTTKKIELWLAGGNDDSDNIFNSTPAMLGENFLNLRQPFKISIINHGHLSKNELHKIYKSADFYISFSKYHDDDYCLSPIEALSTGLPVILSEWGGHLDLIENFPAQVKGISLRNLESAADQIMSFVNMHEGKKFDGHNVRTYFSQVNAIKAIQSLLSDRELPAFQGFSDIFRQWSVTKKRQKFDSVYEDLYSPFGERL
jgi:glycosyltransferase involved in cell wall biosynthesis